MADRSEKIRILIVDDHQVVRQGLTCMFSGEDMEVIGECADGLSAVHKVDELSPDIVLMDIKMPGLSGIDATERIKASHPNVGVVILTLYDEYVIDAIRAGADGYLLKDVKKEELVEAIRHVAQMRGGIVIAIGGRRDRLEPSTLEGPRQHERALRMLSQREKTILDAIALGLPNREIASNLKLSEQTVKNHITNIFRKLGVSTRIEAAAIRLMSTKGEQPSLSERELAVLRLIANGATTKEISSQLFLAEAAVKRTVQRISDKLEVRNRSEAVAEGYRKKLI